MNGLSVFNIKDPLDELLFIICSTKTDEANYRKSFRVLKETLYIETMLISHCRVVPGRGSTTNLWESKARGEAFCVTPFFLLTRTVAWAN